MLDHQSRYQKALQIQREISETLNKSTDLYDILQQTLERLLDLMELKTGWIFLIKDTTSYELVAYQQLPPALDDNREELMHCYEGCTDCSCLQLYWAGKMKQAVNQMQCARLEAAVELAMGETWGLSHHASIPLTIRGKKIGLLNLASPGRRRFEDDELVLLETVAYQIGLAVERVRLHEQPEVLLIERERNRLARDLHDSVNQKLFALSLTSQGLQTMVTENEETIREAIQDLQHLSQEALTDMRSLIWQMRPVDLDQGLTHSLAEYAQKIGVDLSIHAPKELSLNRCYEEALLRIGQEALNNIRKHSGTSKASILLQEDRHQLTMRIIDKGSGGVLETDQSLGITSMKERVKELQGSLHINSEAGKGTTVTVRVPLHEKGR
ncbi:two-component system, NarL family, sensor kinase [Melghirimyces thermohalophilus]|uniref:histidine kinase n=1 Tax=Melghirimyces thermohalophilus TaxID=1236220 RepID=A0A1G6KP12_9BACL|nr:GAF domain-containing sensor histidine kinase [Melghirimyces thermohalophilus]SDC32780.1 two-component system, NarL family, sensor kinase [Melghirimyces thermohalophilus]